MKVSSVRLIWRYIKVKIQKGQFFRLIKLWCDFQKVRMTKTSFDFYNKSHLYFSVKCCILNKFFLFEEFLMSATKKIYICYILNFWFDHVIHVSWLIKTLYKIINLGFERSELCFFLWVWFWVKFLISSKLDVVHTFGRLFFYFS